MGRSHFRVTPTALALVAGIFAPLAVAGAKIDIGDSAFLTIGAGMRAGFTSAEDGAPTGADRSSDFALQSMRLYLGGQITDKIKFTFNTECDGCADAGAKAIVLDAIAQFELSDSFNVWAGRMLTPADRIEMNGPYYALTWNQYTVPLLPSDQTGDAGLFGRDDGLVAWGKIDRFQYSVGVFDGLDGVSNQEDNPLYASRVAYNFLAIEPNPAYYTSSTYFGTAGDVFTLAAFAQHQADGAGTADLPTDFTAYGVDVLFEKVLGGAGVLTLEGEYKKFDTELDPLASGPGCFCLFDGNAYFASAAYLFPQPLGLGKLQPYVRYTSNEPDGLIADSDLVEVGLNYVISGHNARLNINFTNGDANLTGAPGADVNAFFIGGQFQL